MYTPLAAHVEELLRAKGEAYPPLPRALAAASSTCDDVIPEGGAYLTLLAMHGGADGAQPLFSAPFFAVPLPDGGAVVADHGNHRLCVLSGSGAPVVHIGQRGRALGQFTRPLGLALAADGTLLVADDADRVQRFDGEGRALDSFGAAPRNSGGETDDALPPGSVRRRIWLRPGEAPLPASSGGPAPLEPGELSRPNPSPAHELPSMLDMPHAVDAAVLYRTWR